MAIQPIDLQALFSQVDKVGKAQLAQREGLAIQQAIQGAHLQRKTEEHIQEVNEAQNTGDGAEKVKDRREQGAETADGKEHKKKDNEKDDASPAPEPDFFRDPRLGRNIDISL